MGFRESSQWGPLKWYLGYWKDKWLQSQKPRWMALTRTCTNLLAVLSPRLSVPVDWEGSEGNWGRASCSFSVFRTSDLSIKGGGGSNERSRQSLLVFAGMGWRLLAPQECSVFKAVWQDGGRCEWRCHPTQKWRTAGLLSWLFQKQIKCCAPYCGSPDSPPALLSLGLALYGRGHFLSP